MTNNEKGRAAWLEDRQRWRYVWLFPGKTRAQLSREFNVGQNHIDGALLRAEASGFLFYEDDDGRIYSYRYAGARR